MSTGAASEPCLTVRSVEGMGWSDFEEASALERDVLERALPLVNLVFDGSATATVDLAAERVLAGTTGRATSGPTPDRCIDLLRIRPLLVGAAWKILDLLLETALEEAGETPDQGRRWSIGAKVTRARKAVGRPTPFDSTTWSALMLSYAGTAELRHSLTHRTVHADDAGSLIGVKNGRQLRPLSAAEQEAFGRAALRAAQLVTVATPDERLRADLQGHLAGLAGIHRVTLPQVAALGSVAELTVIVDPNVEWGLYEIDFAAVRQRIPFQPGSHADLIIVLRDRPEAVFRGRLEDAPDGGLALDPDRPPAWLSRHDGRDRVVPTW
jgi:hypothetical protein